MDPITQQTVLACAGAGGAGEATYVDDVFSTFLYEGNESTQTITNGIDLSGEGGLVWFKNRDYTYDHALFDTERGATKFLRSNTNNFEVTHTATLTGFNSNGFDLGADGSYALVNYGGSYCSWTFRKAPGFFDVVTWTGDGTDGREIPHSLGSAPGMVIIKRTDSSEHWMVYHRSVTTKYGSLNNAVNFSATGSGFGGYNMQEVFGNSTSVILPDANNITVARFGPSNASGATYVAYVFAHDDQSFGTNSDEAIIKCGSYTGSGSAGKFVDIGFEPQLVIIKPVTNSGGWMIFDNMRGVATGGTDNRLEADVTNFEITNTDTIDFNATGFTLTSTSSNSNTSGNSYAYIAIRRPHKPPTDGDDVLKLNTRSGTGSNATITGIGFVPDAVLTKTRSGTTANGFLYDRLRGNYKALYPDETFSEGGTTTGYELAGVTQETADIVQTNGINRSGNTFIDYFFRRVPGFFDVVAYTGTGSTRTVSHNLGVAPELIIYKIRSAGGSSWGVDYVTSNLFGVLNGTGGLSSGILWNNGVSSTTIGTTYSGAIINQSGATYIAYLFATLPEISKVGSYAGTGNDVDVNCGFSAGARFVLIKRTDSTGDWYVWDTTRGIATGNDPYVLLNSTAAEVTSTDYIDPLNSGFTVTSSAPAALNASGGTYIFLAIA